MSSKQKQKTTAQEKTGFFAGVCRIFSTCKANPIGSAIIAIFLFFFAGIFNSLFGNFFTSCSEVMSNASVGFWRKLVDLYYAIAAKAELTDASKDAACIFYCLLIGALWLTRGSFKIFGIDRMKDIFHEASRNLAKIDNAECNHHDEGENLEHSLQQVRKSCKNLVEDCKKMIASYEQQFRWITFAVAAASKFVAFDLTLKISSYEKIKDFKKSVAVIRPYITDLEYHVLNQKWVLMNSKTDYKNILDMLQAYAKRSDAQRASKKVKNDEENKE